MASTPGGCLYGSVDESSGSELREVDSTSSGATTRVRPHRERTGEDDEVFWNRGYLLFKKGQASTWRAAAVKAVLVTAIVASLGTILAETIPTRFAPRCATPRPRSA